MARLVYIFKTGSTFPDLARFSGDFDAWFSRGLGLHPTRIRVLEASNGHPLPKPEAAAAVVITGSHAMVTDREAWSERLAGWLKEAVPTGLPILGVCFGHQLLAHALGGKVDYRADGPEVGTVEVRLTEHGRQDPLLGGVDETFPAHATHAQSVVSLPPGAVHLAANDMEPHHAFRAGDRAWGLQFHPEFDVEIMRTYVDARAARGECPKCDWSVIRASVRETPASAGLLRRFADLADGLDR